MCVRGRACLTCSTYDVMRVGTTCVILEVTICQLIWYSCVVFFVLWYSAGTSTAAGTGTGTGRVSVSVSGCVSSVGKAHILAPWQGKQTQAANLTDSLWLHLPGERLVGTQAGHLSGVSLGRREF